MIVCDQSNSEQIMNWIKDRLPEVSPALFGAYMTLGVMKNDELVAACIYYEYSGFDMKFSFLCRTKCAMGYKRGNAIYVCIPV